MGLLYMGNNCGERENKITTKISERINFTPKLKQSPTVCSGILPEKNVNKCRYYDENQLCMIVDSLGLYHWIKTSNLDSGGRGRGLFCVFYF